MKKQALNDLTVLDVDDKLKDNEEALQNLRFQKALQQLETYQLVGLHGYKIIQSQEHSM